MATYKFNAVQRYAKFYGSLCLATGPQEDPLQMPAQDSTEGLCAYLTDRIGTLGLSEDDDTIIFRNASYDDFDALAKAVRMATY